MDSNFKTILMGECAQTVQDFLILATKYLETHGCTPEEFKRQVKSLPKEQMFVNPPFFILVALTGQITITTVLPDKDIIIDADPMNLAIMFLKGMSGETVSEIDFTQYLPKGFTESDWKEFIKLPEVIKLGETIDFLKEQLKWQEFEERSKDV